MTLEQLKAVTANLPVAIQSPADEALLAKAQDVVKFSFTKDDIAALSSHTPANHTEAENGRIAGLVPEVFTAAKEMVAHVQTVARAHTESQQQSAKQAMDAVRAMQQQKAPVQAPAR